MNSAFPFRRLTQKLESAPFPVRKTNWGVLGCIIFIISIALLLTLSARAQSPQDNASAASTSTRSCKAIPLDARSNSENNAESPVKSSGSTSTDASPSCLEVQASSLQIQKFLQGFARDQAWALGQQQTSVDSWTFVRLIQKDELSRFAKTEIMGGQINWAEGKVFVKLSTMNAGENYIRVQVSARFEGRGQTSKGFATPNGVWKLISKGTLEGELIAALESHFHSPR